MIRTKSRLVILVMVLVVGIGSIVSCFVQRTRASENIPTFEQYKADYYINYSAYEYFMSEDFSLPYRQIVEKNSNSPTYQGVIKAWQIGTFELSDLADFSKKRAGFYEAFLFDILYKGNEMSNVSKEVEESLKAVKASAFKDLSSMVYDYKVDIASKKLTSMTDEELKEVIAGLEECKELKGAFELIGDFTKVVGYAATLEDLINKLCKVQAISQLSDEYGVVLKEVATRTNDACLPLPRMRLL